MAASAVMDEPAAEDARAPSALLLLLEGRAPWEFGATLVAETVFRGIPSGDGHPVLVFPGMGANDISTVPLRRFLHRRGYAPHGWNFGFNFGPRRGVLRGCIEHVRELHEQYGRKVSLVGWSLGGLFAREVAKRVPELSRCVITLGTPFTGHPKATNAWRLYEIISASKVDDPHMQAQIRMPPPVPTTSIYSKTDGVVSWRCSVNAPGPQTENIEIQASHIGMGGHPAALYAIADRLAQPEGGWKPFERSGARKWFYRTV